MGEPSQPSEEKSSSSSDGTTLDSSSSHDNQKPVKSTRSGMEVSEPFQSDSLPAKIRFAEGNLSPLGSEVSEPSEPNSLLSSKSLLDKNLTSTETLQLLKTCHSDD